MRMGAFRSTILPLLSTFAMVATTPSVVLASPAGTAAFGGAVGRLFCRDTTPGNTFAAWRVTVNDSSKPLLFVNLTVTANNGQTQNFAYFVPAGSTNVTNSVVFTGDPERVRLSGHVSGFTFYYRYLSL
jgi:hypothetical protein